MCETPEKDCLFKSTCVETSRCKINKFYSEELLWPDEYPLILIAVEGDYLGTGFWKVFFYLPVLKDNPKFIILWLWKISLQALFCHCLMIWLDFIGVKGEDPILAATKDSVLCLNLRKKWIRGCVNVVVFCAKGTTCKLLGFDFKNRCPCYRGELDHSHIFFSCGARQPWSWRGTHLKKTCPKHHHWSKPGLKFVLRTVLFTSTGLSGHVDALLDEFRLPHRLKSRNGFTVKIFQRFFWAQQLSLFSEKRSHTVTSCASYRNCAVGSELRSLGWEKKLGATVTEVSAQ